MRPLEGGRFVGPKQSWADVPGEILEHPELGAAAVRVWAYARWRLGLADWILTKSDVMTRCRIGDGGWQRAVRELERAGLYRLERTQAEAGERDRTGKPIGGQQRIEHVFFWPGCCV